MTIKAGGATRVISCAVGSRMSGQRSGRTAEWIQDDLEANVFYLTDGQTPVMLIGCDLAMLGKPFLDRVAGKISGRTGVNRENIIVGCTHTHAGVYTVNMVFDSPPDETYLSRLEQHLTEAAEETVKAAVPARVGWGAGRAHVGYNRRVCWADGTHTMYGDTSRPGFNGLEGPDDPSHAVLFACDRDERVIAVVHNNCCHATCTEGAPFVSADFPGAARACLREALGAARPVLYLQGACGDTSPWDLTSRKKRSGERQRREIGQRLSSETLRLMAAAELREDIPVRVAREDVVVSIRLPEAEKRRWMEETIAQGEEKAGRIPYVHARSLEQLCLEYEGDPRESLAVHAVRIGDMALATNPCELYCQFGLDIKRRSPAAVTMVSELTDGFSGYCPTIAGIMGGGYSADLLYWTRLEPYAGYRIVEAAARLLRNLWP